jgi:PAS domain S-box-containing protein
MLGDSYFLYSHGPDGVFAFVSRGVTEMLGYEQEEFLEHYTTFLTDAPINEEVKRLTDLSLRGQRQPPYEVEIRHKDGSPRRLEVTEIPVRDEGGEVVGVDGIARDVTAQHQAARALAESEQRYRRLFEESNDAVFLHDLDGRIFDVNRAACTMLGYSKEELVGMTVMTLHPDPEHTTSTAALEKTRWRGSARLESWLVRSDGSQVPVEISARIVDRDRGLVQGIVRDVSERKEAERALRESEQRLRFVTSRITDILWTITLDGRFTFATPSCEKLLGYTVEEMLELTTADVLTPEAYERSQKILSTELPTAERTITTAELPHVRKDGMVRPCEVTAVFISDGEGKPSGVIGVTRDITERKRLEERLRQAEKMESVGQLASGVAHDFNNRLVSIRGFAELIAERTDDQQVRDYAERIVGGAQRAADLTSQLLAFGHKGDYQSVPVDIHGVLGEVVLFLERTIDKRIRIAKELRASPRFALGDPTQLQNAILNLAINARDAMPEGGDLLFSTGTTSLDEQACKSLLGEVSPGSYLWVAVTDTGVGMEESTQKRIFEPFFTTKEVGRGTGMGLAAVYGIVKNHGGGVQVDSSPGRGSRFTIYVPLAEGDELNRKAPAAREAACGTAHVLVIDDEHDVRDLLIVALGELGYRVTTCASGREAVDRFRSEKDAFDLVLLDIVMPDLSGADTFRELKAIDPDVKALAVSGFSYDREVRGVLEAGALGFIRKPFEIANLSQRIAAALRDRDA